MASSSQPPVGWLDPDQAAHGARFIARARAAVAAVEACPPEAAAPTLATALEWARVLFDAGLHFEVHEILEPHWVAAEGPAKETLQGLIQVAVGFQHLANQNLAGARALLAEGAARLRRGRLDGLDTDTFARLIAEAAEDPASVPVPPFPAYADRPPVHDR